MIIARAVVNTARASDGLQDIPSATPRSMLC
jgi:hypothetical protein